MASSPRKATAASPGKSSQSGGEHSWKSRQNRQRRAIQPERHTRTEKEIEQDRGNQKRARTRTRTDQTSPPLDTVRTHAPARPPRTAPPRKSRRACPGCRPRPPSPRCSCCTRSQAAPAPPPRRYQTRELGPRRRRTARLRSAGSRCCSGEGRWSRQCSLGTGRSAPTSRPLAASTCTSLRCEGFRQGSTQVFGAGL